MNQSTSVRTLVAQLVAAGLRHVVISPGSRSTPLVQAVAERPELTLHLALDERTAAFLALGLHRGTGAWCATVCTSGSAAAHGLPAAIEAVESGDHLLILTADRPASVRGLGASQAIVQPGLLAPYATHFVEWDAATPHQPTQLAHALGSAARHGGVIHVNVPLSMPLALEPGMLPAATPHPALVVEPPSVQIPPPVAGERTLLLLGPLPHHATLGAFLAARVDPGQVVVIAEPASRLRDQLPGVIHGDTLLRLPEVRAQLLPDRIIRIGAWPVSKGMQLLLDDAARAGVPVDVVHPRRTSDPLRQNRVTSLDDPVDVLRDWPTTAPSRPDPWTQAWHALDAAVAWPAQAWHEAAIVTALAHHLPREGTLLLGNSMPIRDWHSFAPPISPQVHVEVSRGAAGIDGNLATAIGVAIGRQHAVTAYVGDSTFLHDIGSLQLLTADRLGRASLRLVVVDNRGGAIFDYLPARQAMSDALHERCFTVAHHLDLAAVARGFGLVAHDVADLASLERALATPLGAGSVDVIVARVDRAKGEAMHRAFWADAAARVRARGTLG